jgi:asparagine synthase (glutamine-hydrolysing)
MCGVAAIFAYHPASPPADTAELAAMSARMAARGPDGVGIWVGADGRLALGHRRLAIIDLDERAAQPMVSACGRFVLSFNGEIYNNRELREELVARGCRFRTTSDTEVLLELFAREGKVALSRLRGMFALALWDERERVLWLARDPYGIKPLYYADDGWTVRAASQVKALLAGGGVSRDPEPAGIVGFFLLGSVPEPFTCFQDIRAVPAGALVRVDTLGAHAPEPFAAVAAVLRGGERTMPAPDAREDVRAALLDSVRHHLVADVPVGLLLSPDIDSGALLALMAEARGGAGEPIRAVTVVFPEYHGRPDEEAPLAAELAGHFGAEHTVRVVDEEEFAADLPRLLEAMDQPTIDGVNIWFVSKAARELGLKVTLSGLGGDELFADYPSFHDLPRWVRTLAIPSRVPLAGRALRALLTRLGEARGWHPNFAGLLELGGTWPGAYLLRRGVFMPWELETVLQPEIVRAGLRRLRWPERIAALLRGGPTTPLARVALLEAGLHMRHQLLRNTDWASMAHSLEVRVPLVDLALLRRVEPLSLRRPLRGKTLLAASPTNPLPEGILRRAKTGFNTPVERWMDRLAGPAAAHRPEALARRWERFVAQATLPDSVLRHRPSQASGGASALAKAAS